MRLILHTLKKDARRLWPAVAVTWLILAALASADQWREDWMPSPTEGWMNLLLSGAWACLVALAVFEEPLVGDRHFWLTRPHRWPALLAAKLIFVALAIHLPSFLADIFVLTARGFSPAAHLGDLLSKQVLLIGGLVLPAMAVAALVRNFTQFVLALSCIGTGLAVRSGGFQFFPNNSGVTSEVRDTFVFIFLAGTAVAVVYIQYARRSVMIARVTGIAAALAAAAVFAYLPARAEYAVRGAGAGETPRILLRNPTSDQAARAAGMVGPKGALLSIAITPGAASTPFRIPLIDIEIVAPDGSRIQSVRPTSSRQLQKIDLLAYPYSVSPNGPQDGLVLRFSDPAWNRVKNARVRVRGTAAIVFYHPGETTILPAQGSVDAPGLGRCTAFTVEDPFSEKMLKVLCESPRALPVAHIALRHEPSGRVWRHDLNSPVLYSPWPHAIWLSPVHRGQSYFVLTNSDALGPDSQSPMPASYLSSARVEITPEIVTGRALAHFDFADVALSSWLAQR